MMRTSKKVCGNRATHLNLLGKGGTEHHGLACAFAWHGILLHNTPDLWLKTHVQHSVSFIQNQVTGGEEYGRSLDSLLKRKLEVPPLHQITAVSSSHCASGSSTHLQ